MSQPIHTIDLPKKVVVGRGVIEDAPSFIAELHLPRPLLLVTGPRVLGVAGRRLQELLEDKGYNVYSVVVEEATVKEAEKVASMAREIDAGTIIGLGGGKSIDVAKYASSKTDKVFVSMPTAPSHDGVASPFASLRGSTSHPMSFRAREPMLILADLDVMAKAPRRLVASGVGDMVGKFTAVLDWRLAHRLLNEYYGEYAASLALMSAKHVARYVNEIARGGAEGVRILVEALISSSVAMCIAGSTRPASGSEHLFSHALDLVASHPALHGEQVGMGTIMMSYLHGRNWKAIRKVLRIVGAPTTAKELGVTDEQVLKALVTAHKIRPERYTILGDRGLSWEAAEKLARITGVID